MDPIDDLASEWLEVHGRCQFEYGMPYNMIERLCLQHRVQACVEQ